MEGSPGFIAEALVRCKVMVAPSCMCSEMIILFHDRHMAAIRFVMTMGSRFHRGRMQVCNLRTVNNGHFINNIHFYLIFYRGVEHSVDFKLMVR
jgi:hypothetical protein